MDALLELQNVSRRFGGLHAVDEVTFSVRQGEIVGLIGPNGAGKTTIFNLITRIYPLSSGHLLFDGRTIERCAGHQITANGIARTFQNPRVFKSLTVLQHAIVGMPNGRSKPTIWNVMRQLWTTWKLHRQRAAETLELVGLENEADCLAAAMPYGKRRLVEIARCLATEPQLLLLDEPSAGLNDAETDRLREILQRIVSERRLSLIVIEHDIGFVRKLCPRLLAMCDGQLICDGPTPDVLNDEAVIEAYLGEV